MLRRRPGPLHELADGIGSDGQRDFLLAWGVDTVFGIPGDGINGIIEAFRKRGRSGGSRAAGPGKVQSRSSIVRLRQRPGRLLRVAPAGSHRGTRPANFVPVPVVGVLQ